MNANFGLLDDLPARSRQGKQDGADGRARPRATSMTWRIANCDHAGSPAAPRRLAGRRCRRQPHADSSASPVPSSSTISTKSATSPIRSGLQPRSRRVLRLPRPTLRQRGVVVRRDVDRLAIRGFLGELDRRGLGKRSIARALSAVRSFYRWMHHARRIDAFRRARVGARRELDKYLPAYLERAQIDLLFAHAELRASGGRFERSRDLAMLELFYSTGHAALRAAQARPRRSRSRAQAGEGARQGTQGADRPGRRPAQLALRYLRRESAWLTKRLGARTERYACFLGRRGPPHRRAHRPASSSRLLQRDRRGRGTAACTRCGTRSPRTCSMPAPTCRRCRSSWATHRSPRRRSTRTQRGAAETGLPEGASRA